MLGTEETSWLLSRMVKFNLFLLDIPTQRRKKNKKKFKKIIIIGRAEEKD